MSEQSPTSNEKNTPSISGGETDAGEAILEHLKSLAAALKETSLPDALIERTGVLSGGSAKQHDGVVTYLDDDQKLLARVEGFSGRNADLLVSVDFPAAELGYPMPSVTGTEALSVEHLIEAERGVIKVRTEMKPVTEPAGPYRYVTHGRDDASNPQQPGDTASYSVYDTFDLTGPVPTINRLQQVTRFNDDLHLEYDRSEDELPIETVPEHTLRFIADTLEATVQAIDDPSRWEKIRPRPVS